MKLRFGFLVWGILVHISLLHAAPVTDTVEIESLFRTIETNYGPLEYKSGRVGLDWERTKETYRARLAAAKSTNEFYLTAAELLGELKDAHVQAQLPSSYDARLPLQLSYVEGKTVVNYIGGKLAKAGTCAIDVGDELITFDGESVDDVRAALGRVRGLGNSRSDQSFLTRALTVRQEKSGLPVPHGDDPKAALEFRRADGRTVRCEVAWETKGYPLVNLTPAPDETPSWAEYSAHKPLMAFVQHLIHLQNELVLLKAPLPLDGLLGNSDDKDAKGKKIEIGHKQPFYPMPRTYHAFQAPSLMHVLIQATGMQAGTFLHNGKTVGYLRIPDYMAGHPIIAQFALRYIMMKLQDEAQYLVLDQTNNPGGYVQFSDAVVESLTGRIDRDHHMRFSVRPTQDFIRIYAEILALLERATENEALAIPKDFRDKYMPLLKAEMAKVVAAYERNEKLSAPIDFHIQSSLVQELVDRLLVRLLSEEYPSFAGVLKYAARSLLGIDPTRKYVFTKPVYMLINELDFSAGDATPAVLKDYDRVTLVGVNTAGAGGSVGIFSHHVKNPFKFSLTQSLMIRKGDVMVENVGVKPDIPLEMTLEDIRTGYKGYFARVMAAIDAHRAAAP